MGIFYSLTNSLSVQFHPFCHLRAITPPQYKDYHPIITFLLVSSQRRLMVEAILWSFGCASEIVRSTKRKHLDIDPRRNNFRCPIFYHFQATHNGHFSRLSVQKQDNFGKKVAKNDHCVLKMCFMAF